MTNPQEVGSYDWGKSFPTISSRGPRANPLIADECSAAGPRRSDAVRTDRACSRARNRVTSPSARAPPTKWRGSSAV